MELSVRDWMIVVGVLLIVVVLIDGYRRVRNERRGNIRMSLNRSFLNSGEEDNDHSSELPNGGARIIGSREFQKFNRQSASYDGEPQIGDEDLDLSQTVPLLMESVESNVETVDDAAADDTSSLDEKVDSVQAGYSVNNETEAEGNSTDGKQAIDEGDDSPFQHNLLAEGPEEAPRVSSKRASYDPDQQEVFVINVNAKNELFKGPDLLHILLACDLRFGDMNIFHRHENANGTGAVQFSMANSVHPGTFDLEEIDDFSSPSVSFFMSMPGPKDPMQAFDYMVETAQCLVKNLGGELRDESRSVMTLQTLEHCRQRIRDAERRQLTQNA